MMGPDSRSMGITMTRRTIPTIAAMESEENGMTVVGSRVVGCTVFGTRDEQRRQDC